MKSFNMTTPKNAASIPDLIDRVNGLFARIPDDVIALLGRISMGAIFWLLHR